MTVTIDYALTAHANGYTVIPPHEDGSKRPDGPWKHYQTTRPDEPTIHNWYDRGRHGFGVLCGAASGNLEMLEFEGRAATLWPNYRKACADAGIAHILESITNGYAERTPSGGIHLLYRCDTPIGGNIKLARRPATPDELAEKPDDKVKTLIETRGEGGYVVLHPSDGPVHPTGKAWQLVRGGLTQVATITGEQRDLLHALARTFDEPLPDVAPQTPADIEVTAEREWTRDDGWFGQTVDSFNNATTWDQILTGWTRMHTRNGITYWCRPGKNPRDGHSATTNSLGTDRLIVFSSSVAGFETYDGAGKAPSYDRFSAHAILEHRGDRTQAARTQRTLGHGPPEHATDLTAYMDQALLHNATTATTTPPGDTETDVATELPERPDWAPLDLTDILAGNVERPEPTILCAPDSTPLIYPGRVNGVFGESGVGKTWITLLAIAQVIRDGGTAVLIDLEDSPHGIIPRLRDMGITDTELVDRFAYLAPSTSWNQAAVAAVRDLIDRLDPELVVIDSTGEAMAMSGVKGNDDDDVARWFRYFPRLIADLGPAVLVVDHIPKDPNAPSSYAIGSQRKRAAINGAAYRVDAIRTPSRDSEGLLKLIVAKDRHGARPVGAPAAMIHITPSLGRTVVKASVPDGDIIAGRVTRPTTLMTRVSEYLETHPGATSNAIETNVEGKATGVRKAVEVLIMEGYVERESGHRGALTHRLLRPFNTLTDLVDNPSTTDLVPPRPYLVPPRGDDLKTTSSLVPPPYGGRGQVEGPWTNSTSTTSSHHPGTRSVPITPDNDDL